MCSDATGRPTNLDRALGHLSSRRMLYVAAGSGRMARFLMDRLASYSEVLGVDLDETVASAFHTKLGGGRDIRFEVMDALALPFPPASFDTVCMSRALCEFDDAGRQTVLQTLKRIVVRDGVIVISESFRDHAAEPERTHVLLHDWWGEVDASEGILHRPFGTKAQLKALIEPLGFRTLRYYHVRDTPSDPH